MLFKKGFKKGGRLSFEKGGRLCYLGKVEDCVIKERWQTV